MGIGHPHVTRAFERASLCKYLYCLDRWVKDHIDKQRVSKLVIQSGRALLQLLLHCLQSNSPIFRSLIVFSTLKIAFEDAFTIHSEIDLIKEIKHLN